MDTRYIGAALTGGLLLAIGFFSLGGQLSGSVDKLKAFDRTVTVKGLSEREVPANIAIWPISFTEADNDLPQLYEKLQKQNTIVLNFLKKSGFSSDNISFAAPSIVDRQAQQYDNSQAGRFRYTGKSVITVYSDNVELVRKSTEMVVELVKQGIAINADEYQSKTQFMFNGLNDLKPSMIEESNKNARAVAEKFAADSHSSLGKIKTASQGQFSVEDRDTGTPYIKKVRVVSTIEYYLTD